MPPVQHIFYKIEPSACCAETGFCGATAAEDGKDPPRSRAQVRDHDLGADSLVWGFQPSANVPIPAITVHANPKSQPSNATKTVFRPAMEADAVEKSPKGVSPRPGHSAGLGMRVGAPQNAARRPEAQGRSARSGCGPIHHTTLRSRSRSPNINSNESSVVPRPEPRRKVAKNRRPVKRIKMINNKTPRFHTRPPVQLAPRGSRKHEGETRDRRARAADSGLGEHWPGRDVVHGVIPCPTTHRFGNWTKLREVERDEPRQPLNLAHSKSIPS